MRLSPTLLRWRSAGTRGPKRRSSLKYLPRLNTPATSTSTLTKVLGYLAKIERNPAFSLDYRRYGVFENILGEQMYKGGRSMRTYNMDWTGHYEGASKLVLKPRNTEESQKFCLLQ